MNMLGYTRYDNGFDITAKTLGWVLVIAGIFSTYLIYCGFNTYLSRDGEVVGQAKSITRVTPFWSVCAPYYMLDVSVGVMVNGVGSLSTHDVGFTVADTWDVPAMLEAVQHAKIIRVRYDTRRLAACTEDNIATGFDVSRAP
jgi:hypothetical protein